MDEKTQGFAIRDEKLRETIAQRMTPLHALRLSVFEGLLTLCLRIVVTDVFP